MTINRSGEMMGWRSENEIHAAYMDMFNKGQNAVLRLSGDHLSLSQWRDEQIAAFKASQPTRQEG